MCVCVCVCVSSNGSCRSVVILYIHAAHGSFWFGWGFTRVYASRAFLWLQLCFFLQYWINILQVWCKVLTLVLTYINVGCVGIQSHEPCDLPQPCDDTLSVLQFDSTETDCCYCNWLCWMFVPSIIKTHHRQTSQYQMSRPNLYLGIMDEELRGIRWPQSIKTPSI